MIYLVINFFPCDLILNESDLSLQVLQNAKPLTRLPLIGPLLTPPVSAASVGKAAVRAATDPVFPPGIVDVYGIMRYSEQN
jgi:hypothetical protein